MASLGDGRRATPERKRSVPDLRVLLPQSTPLVAVRRTAVSLNGRRNSNLMSPRSLGVASVWRNPPQCRSRCAQARTQPVHESWGRAVAVRSASLPQRQFAGPATAAPGAALVAAKQAPIEGTQALQPARGGPAAEYTDGVPALHGAARRPRQCLSAAIQRRVSRRAGSTWRAGNLGALERQERLAGSSRTEAPTAHRSPTSWGTNRSRQRGRRDLLR